MHPGIPLDAATKARRRAAGTLALEALLLSTLACRTSAPWRESLVQGSMRLALPLESQPAESDCGVASVAALCSYWGVALPPEKRADLARRAQASDGLSGAELCTTLTELGFEVSLFHGSLDRSSTGLLAHVDARRPLLVMSSSDREHRHYGLVIGYDEAREALLVLDPTQGEVSLAFTSFVRDWARCQHFTLLACRAETAAIARAGTEAPPRLATSSTEE